MKKLILFFLLFSLSSLNSQSLKIIYGDRLYYQKGEKFLLVKQREHGSSFQGYDMVDSTHIFLAYAPENCAEASTHFAVYDIKNETEYFIEEIGGTGESFFVYNKINDLVLFDWHNGINVFKLHKSNGEIIDNVEAKLIVECRACYLPFWVDCKTIGYVQFENGEWVIKYFKMEE